MHGSASARTLNVLVVDDYQDAAATLSVLLERWGHNVRVAQSGVEALAAARSFRPNVVLLDIEMPNMHGGEVARRLRRLPGGEQISIIAVSGTDPDDQRLDGYTHLFDGYLAKPYNLDRLEHLLGNHVSSASGA